MQYNKGFCIGDIKPAGYFGLAPMAGVGDAAFRHVCRVQGADYTVTEMVSAKALCYGDVKTHGLLRLASGEHPCAVQIFGSEPDIMARGAQLALEYSGADIVDINMGCPAEKIVSGGDGAALLKKPKLAFEIIRSVKNAVDCPVTVKIRAGWDVNSVTAVGFARICEDAGCDAICIHGRTADMAYSGRADIEIMSDVVAAVGVPVMVNGDITNAHAGAALLSMTGARYALIGRGALGNPWIFRDCRAYMGGAEVQPLPDIEERLEMFMYQTSFAAKHKGEMRACLESRTHFCHYLRGIKNAANFRREAVAVRTLSDIEAVIAQVISSANEETDDD